MSDFFAARKYRSPQVKSDGKTRLDTTQDMNSVMED